MKPDVVITAYTPGSIYEDLIPLVGRGWEIMGYAFTAIPAQSWGTGIDACDGKLTRLFSPLDYDDEIICLADADMLPLSESFFRGLPTPEMGQILAVGYDAYAMPEPCKWPMHYTTAHAKTWREIINPAGSTLSGLVGWFNGLRIFDHKESPTTTAFSDESLLRALVYYWCEYDARLLRVNRGWDQTPDGPRCHNRIDRADWKIDMDKLQAGEYIDAHLPRGPDWKEKVKPLADYLGLTI